MTVPEERAPCLVSPKEACEHAESRLLCFDRRTGTSQWVWVHGFGLLAKADFLEGEGCGR